nr:16S rRNA processing protein RimM [Desulfobulbaceae bacterium]
MADRSTTPEDLLSVGKIVKAQGVKGEVKVLPFSGHADDLLCYGEFFISRGLEIAPFAVNKSRVHGKFCVLKLASIDSRDDAEQLVGLEISVPRDAMPELPDDEFYWHDFEGLRVVTEQGVDLGKVIALIATGSNDVLVVAGKGKEYLIPAIDEIIVDVNWDTETVVIAPLPGLLEINDPDVD